MRALLCWSRLCCVLRRGRICSRRSSLTTRATTNGHSRTTASWPSSVSPWPSTTSPSCTQGTGRAPERNQRLRLGKPGGRERRGTWQVPDRRAAFPGSRPAREKIAEDIRTVQPRALDARLMPKVEDDADARTSCRMLKVADSTYPPDAERTAYRVMCSSNWSSCRTAAPAILAFCTRCRRDIRTCRAYHGLAPAI